MLAANSPEPDRADLHLKSVGLWQKTTANL